MTDSTPTPTPESKEQFKSELKAMFKKSLTILDGEEINGLWFDIISEMMMEDGIDPVSAITKTSTILNKSVDDAIKTAKDVLEDD